MRHDTVRAAVYQLLDQVLADRAVAAGARGAIFSVVDTLRANLAPIDEIRRAEGIAIEMHKLQCARQQQDQAAAGAALDELKLLAASCLSARIDGRN